MNRNTLRTATVVVAFLAAGQAFAAKDPAVTKPVNTLIQAIKQGRDELALKQFATEEQGKRLVSEAEWAKATPAQKKEFQELFQKLFAALGFPNFRENFKYLDAINFAGTSPTATGALADSVIVLDHPMKKQELKVKFELLKAGGGYKVVDAGIQGMGMDSMLKSIRDDNKLPEIVARDGFEGLLKIMRERLAEVQKKQKA